MAKVPPVAADKSSTSYQFRVSDADTRPWPMQLIEWYELKMSLGKKIVALFFVLGLSFSIGSFVALRLAVFPAFEDFEQASSTDTLESALQALDDDLRTLKVTNKEYSVWDQTYEWAMGGRPEYPAENLDASFWRDIGIHLVLIFDTGGNLLYEHLADPSTGEIRFLQDELLRPLSADHMLVTLEQKSEGVTGLLRTRSGSVQVVSYPILRSYGSGPPAGKLVVGQFLTDTRIASLGEHTTATMSLHSATSRDLPPVAAMMLQAAPGTGMLTRWDYSAEYVQGNRLLRDIFGAPAAVLEINIPRTITQIGANTIQAATTFLAGACAFFLLTGYVFLRRLIIAPVKRLTTQILHIQQTGDLHFESIADRNDEIGVLAGEFGVLTLDLARAKKELEDARDNAVETSKTKSEFLARMSHEIRTPMNGVLGMTELLRDTVLDDKQQRFAKTIYESAESLLEIINDILDFSKIEAGKLQLEMIDVDLRTLLEDIVDNLAGQAQRKGLELTNVIPPDLENAVLTDPVRLRQVLTNLVSNAIKFTDSGEVIVRLEVTDIGDNQQSVRFSVADTGLGIKHDKQDLIFDLFTQADGTTTRLHGGTGLGLSISRQIVELMGGELTVDSTPGAGSTFSFVLTMDTGCKSRFAATGIYQYVAGKHVLVVDDNATNREILEHQLTSWRARADSATSAEQAIEKLGAALLSGRPYDLAILDMNMPATDGLDCARAIRRNSALSRLKLVILSSVALPVAEQTLRELEIGGQLMKPIRQSHLYSSLIAILGGDKVAECHPVLNPHRSNALSGHVLLAEDNPVNQAVAIGMLEALGLTVVVAANGQEAVDKAAAETFGVLLMDCQMPYMDGFKATEIIRGIEVSNGNLPIPIVAVTANALKGDREKCLAAGMNEYLTKPFTNEQLHSVLALYLPQDDAARKVSPIDEHTEHIDAVTQADDSPIDRSTLDVLSRLQQPGAPSLLQKVIHLYLDSSSELKGRLATAVAGMNTTVVRENAHALKSSSANVGATRLADLCKRLEHMARKGDLSGAASIQERLEREYSRVVTALKVEAKSAAA